jgi:hypothetical protein
VIDIETVNYAFQEREDRFRASRILRERNPNAVLYATRMGYPAVTKMGGSWKRRTE